VEEGDYHIRGGGILMETQPNFFDWFETGWFICRSQVFMVGGEPQLNFPIKSMLKKLVSPFKKLFSRLRLNNKSIDDLNGVLRRMVT
jgi:hypothetical protein